MIPPLKRVYDLAIPPMGDYLDFAIPPMHPQIEICKYTFEMYQLCLVVRYVIHVLNACISLNVANWVSDPLSGVAAKIF